jgi:hypothetical protein
VAVRRQRHHHDSRAEARQLLRPKPELGEAAGAVPSVVVVVVAAAAAAAAAVVKSNE